MIFKKRAISNFDIPHFHTITIALVKRADFSVTNDSIQSSNWLSEMSEVDNAEVHVNVTTLTRSDDERIDDDGSNSSADFSVPGVSEFTPLPSATETPASWNKGLTKEDCAYMQRKFAIIYLNLVFFSSMKIQLS